MNKILVTGSAGFIGFHLTHLLLKQGYNVLGIDSLNSYYDITLKINRTNILKKFKYYSHKKLDLVDMNKLSKLVERFNPNLIIHLAAQAGVRYSFSNPREYIDSNIIGFHNIISLAKEINVKNFVYASSSSVYGDQKKFPIDEENNTSQPNSLYAATKKSNELISYTYSKLFNLKTTGLRFFTVYGPWGRPDMSLFKFTKSILDKQTIEIYNGGNHTRDFTYIDDITHGISNIVDISLGKLRVNNSNLISNNYNVYNLGNGNPITLKKFLKIIERQIGLKAKIKYLSLQPGDTIKTHSNISKARKDFLYQPKTPIEIGIPNFISWYQDYYA